MQSKNTNDLVFNIITRCTRPQNLKQVQDSIFQDGITTYWHILFDTSCIKDIDAELLSRLKAKFYFMPSNNDMLAPQSTQIASKFEEGYVYYVDDDNLMHPQFYNQVASHISNNPEKLIFIVSQQVDGKDFSKLETREATPDNTKLGGIDSAQIIYHYSIFKDHQFVADYTHEGILINQLYAKMPDKFYWINQILSYYNYLQQSNNSFLPKVLFIGAEEPVFKSKKYTESESDILEVKYEKNDSNLSFTQFKPDAIVTNGDLSKFPNLMSQIYEIRKKWINVNEINASIGEKAYYCAMTQILNQDNSKLISYFTPVYNRGKKLYKTYQSLKNQTYDNWEWVLVNDSSDSGTTLKVAEEIASQDIRVKIYDFREKSKGIIGEAKYRAAMLCRGYLLAELDHDDQLMPNCTKWLYNASHKHPEAGFFYTFNAEVDQDWKPLTYSKGFCFGYGKYFKENAMGRQFEVAVAANINPKTIRHIVGVPNHIRAWKRDLYLSIGGHNRDLTIADDYELIVRTFLKTKMVLIPKFSYIQIFEKQGSAYTNTHDSIRPDIQRRVRSIMYHYNQQIAERFKELGVVDWAYRENPKHPTSVPSKFGEEEQYVNLIYQE